MTDLPNGPKPTGPDPTGPDPTAALLGTAACLAQAVDALAAALGRGEAVDLAGLDARIEGLCQAALSLADTAPHCAAAITPVLTTLAAQLAVLDQHIRSAGPVAPAVPVSATARQRATHAYRRAKSPEGPDRSGGSASADAGRSAPDRPDQP